MSHRPLESLIPASCSLAGSATRIERFASADARSCRECPEATAAGIVANATAHIVLHDQDPIDVRETGNNGDAQ
ncbi:hypothetical protein [Burkholderia sp. BCC0322]|uniref:hypothetical protein n=1 Tax=unclassified Burkholderia TaxID=2613784 RepID=UPI00158E7E47|nr:hypothetical protein [Burkholderia sp. BCC0322]